MSPTARPRRVALWVMVIVAISSWLGTECRAGERVFRRYTGDDGLAQLAVSSILQGRDGVLWAGTQAGISRFDGVHFTTIDTRNGLPNDWINALAEGPDGSIWAGTNGGIARLRKDGTVENPQLPLDAVTDLAVTPDGTLWLGTPHGLYRLDDETGLTEVGHERGLPSGLVVSLAVDAHGVVHCVFDDGSLFRIADDGHVEARPTDSAHLETPRDLMITRDGTTWLARVQGVEVRSPDGTVRLLTAGRDFVDGRPSVLTEAPDGTVWLGTQEGVVAFQLDGTVETLTTDDGLPFSGVNAIAIDDDDMLWMGGFGGLVAYTGYAFTNFTSDHGLPASNVRPVLRTRDGTLWVGTVKGLARARGDGFEAVPIVREGENRWVLHLHEDRRGRLWVATNRGLFRRDGESFVRVVDDANARWVDQVIDSVDGEIWASRRNRPVLRSRDGEHFEEVSIPGENFGNGRLLAHSDGSVWYSGKRGLSRFDGEAWRTWTVADGLAAAEPYWLVEGPDGGVWFGYHSSQGFTRFDGTSFRTWTTKDGLTHPAVFSLGFDRDGVLWVGTARGVDRFDGTHFVNYGKPEGYGSAESNSGGFFADVDGALWFGTAEGLTRYEPWHDHDRTAPPRVRLADVTLDGMAFEDGARVPNDQRDLFAYVHIPHFDPPRRFERRVRLVGDGYGWRPIEEATIHLHNLAPGTYTLEAQARRYGGPWSASAMRSFTVQHPWWQSWWMAVAGIALMYGFIRVSLHVRTMRIRQHNEYLEQCVAERTNELAEKNAELRTALGNLNRTSHELSTVNERLVEADQAKSRFLANMSHEIRTPMNGVIGMTSLLMETDLDEEQSEFVDIVRRSGDQLLGVINDILDFSKIEAGALELEQRPFDLRTCAEDAGDLLAVKVAEKKIDLVVSVDPRLPRSVVGDVTRLRQVLVNLLGNAVKFTGCGHVWLRVEPDDRDDFVRFTVRDTGIGIDPDKAATLFDAFSQADTSTTRKFGGTGLGLAISKQLVDAMEGDLTATGKKGEGATFRFTARLPVDLDDDGQPLEPTAELEGLRLAAMIECDPLWEMIAELAAALGVVVHRMDAGASSELAAGGLDGLILDRDALDGPTVDRARAQARRLGLPSVCLTRVMDRSNSTAVDSVHLVSKPLKVSALVRALSKVARGAPSGDTAAVETVVSAVESGVATQTHVLVAEDDAFSQRLIGRVLDQLGYEHLVVADGRAALDALETAAFDVVLMDARMPVMDGLEATRRIRAREDWHQPFIVAMTADSTDASRAEAMRAGMDTFLGKPVTKDGLQDLLARVATGQLSRT